MNFICLLDVVIESLENYRSTGSAFPLRQSNLFEYLPPSNHYIVSPIVSNHIPSFTSSINRRIDLTPGVLVPVHRYRRLPSFTNSPNRVPKKIKSIKKKLIPVRSKRQLIARKFRTKLTREHLSHQFSELIRMNRESLILNNEVPQQDSTVI